MFGLTIEKIIIIGIVAAVFIGPRNLPVYASRLAELIRQLRDLTHSASARIEAELGITLDPAELNARIQQYNPQRIIQNALADELPIEEPLDQNPPAATKWIIVGGSSGHPQRRLVIDKNEVQSPLDPAVDTMVQ